MSNGHPTVLRERVLNYVDIGHSKSETGRVFKVSRPTINKWIHLREQGDYSLKPRTSRRLRKIKEEELRAYIKAHPDAYLNEIGKALGVSANSIWHAVRRFGITLKKRSRGIKKEIIKNE